MITGIPSYRPPVVEPVRCQCLSFYMVYVGSTEEEAREAEIKAQQMGAVFVDSRRRPFIRCWCGQVLDFAPEASMMVM